MEYSNQNGIFQLWMKMFPTKWKIEKYKYKYKYKS
jgi:hypothetical protein